MCALGCLGWASGVPRVTIKHTVMRCVVGHGKGAHQILLKAAGRVGTAQEGWEVTALVAGVRVKGAVEMVGVAMVGGLGVRVGREGWEGALVAEGREGWGEGRRRSGCQNLRPCISPSQLQQQATAGGTVRPAPGLFLLSDESQHYCHTHTAQHCLACLLPRLPIALLPHPGPTSSWCWAAAQWPPLEAPGY